MEKFTLTIDTDNEAFVGDTREEIARVLRQLAKDVIKSGDYMWSPDFAFPLLDCNGNKVGEARLETER
jgi:hypothetical protein